MSAPSRTNPGTSGHRFKQAYHDLDYANLPSADEVQRSLAAARKALQPSSRPSDQFLGRFAEGTVPTADEAKELEAALVVFDPFKQQASATATLALKARVSHLEDQLKDSNARVGQWEFEAAERDEIHRQLSSQDGHRQDAQQSKVDKLRSDLEQALDDVRRLTSERDSAVQEQELCLAEAQAKAKADATKFKTILKSRLQEQATAFASGAATKEETLAAELAETALVRERTAASTEATLESELKALATEHACEVETKAQIYQ
jgi:hypothetical protein